MKTFQDYHDLYLKLNILLLINCIKGFQKLIKGKFKLDVVYYVSLSSFVKDALYKTIG